MNTKVNEGKLISKKQAATAFIDGEDVEFMDQTGQWRAILDNTVLKVFLDRAQFRLKPRTITINGIEAPSIKKESAIYRSNDTVAIVCESFEDAELMCLALRQVFGGSHDN